MSLSPDQRAAFLELMPQLTSPHDEPPEPVVAFVRDRFYDCVEELGAQPGLDRVRAGLLRIVPRLLEADERDRVLAAAAAAVEAYEQAVGEGDPVLGLVRHPAWVGLSAVELAEAAPAAFPGGVDRAVQLASMGFRSIGGAEAAGRGEVLWAMAEQAEEMGWLDRSRQLLGAALDGPFADPANADRVRLLLSRNLLDDDDTEGAATLLEEIVASAESDEPTRIHARFILAHLLHGAGEVEAARESLREALREAASEGDDDVVERIKGALGALDED